MKRNQSTIRAAHVKGRSSSKKSKYAQKVASGKQMYGPDCCAHTRRTPYRTPMPDSAYLDDQKAFG